MPRFFLPPSAIQNNRFVLSGSEAHHAAHVLRKKPGDLIDLFDGQNAAYKGRIESVDADRVEGTLLEDFRAEPWPVQLTLYQALSRSPKWDWLVEKVCEVGVSRLVPIATHRSLVKLPASQHGAKLARWQRIALAAAKQSGRSQVMTVESPREFSAALAALEPQALSLIPYEKESERSIRDACQGYAGSQVNLFVGPEGGWDPEEVELARQRGVIPVRLGPTLLRTETAGIVASALVLREFGLY
jgi:16S rRNA (uracil1498-N3)-methyltransferase